MTRAVAVVLGIFGLFWTWASRPVTTGELAVAHISTRIGAFAPSFTVAAPANGLVALENFKGKVVVLNFWASWCPPCRAEMAALNQVKSDYEGRDVVVLAINQMEPEQTAVGFVQEQHLEFVVGLDTDGHVTELYRVSALPTTYFIDKTGIIRDIVYGGPMTRPLVESKVNSILDH